VLVYPVDLMKLYLIRKNLDDVATVNLAGIKPFHTAEKDLGAAAEYRDRTTDVSVPIKTEGAYLVVAKGDGIEASGLVVVTDLGLEVQEDSDSGRLRLTVRNEKSGRFEEDAHVKVVGSESGDFVSGDTDLRGVFEAGNLIGEATVIVKKKTSYAFFRGTTLHQPDAAIRRRASRDAPAAMAKDARGNAAQQLDLGELEEAQQLLEDLDSANRAIQGKQIDQLREMTRNKQQGMQAQQARRK
jgi:hypothetical protein